MTDAERLQAAARQLIAAGRAFLDVAEDMVEDPDRLTDAASSAARVVREAVVGLTDRGADPWVASASGASAGDAPGSDASASDDPGTETSAAEPSAADGPSGEDPADGTVEGDDADLLEQWRRESPSRGRVRRVSVD